MENQVQPSAAPVSPEVMAPALRVSRWEFPLALLILLAFFGFNLVTYTGYPEAWCDEIWYSEPAVNFVHYGSFTTMVDQRQEPGTFPVPGCPLYLMALVPWLSAVGTTLLAVRSFNYVLIALAALLLWVVSWRFNLVKSSLHRLLILPLLHLGYGMSFSYRSSRPDILGLVCLLLLLLCFLMRRPVLRNACLVLLSAVIVWVGFQVGLFAWFACLMAWLVLRRVGFRELLLCSVGMVGAAAMLLLFLAWKGVLAPFMTLTFGMLGRHYAHQSQGTVAAALPKLLGRSVAAYATDFSTLVVTLGLVVLLAASWRRLNLATRRLAIYCLLLTFGVPLLFNLVGHFAFYYSYMQFVPAALVLLAVYSASTSASSNSQTASRWVFLVTLAVAMAVGLPLRLAVTAVSTKVAPRQEIQRIINSIIRPDDVVFSDYAYFFEVKRVAQAVYDRFCSPVLLPMPIPGRDLTPMQKQSVSVMVIRPEEKDMLARYFGSQWTAVSAPFGDSLDPSVLSRLPLVGSRFVSYLHSSQTDRYQVQVFRRAPNSLEPATLP